MAGKWYVPESCASQCSKGYDEIYMPIYLLVRKEAA